MSLLIGASLGRRRGDRKGGVERLGPDVRLHPVLGRAFEDEWRRDDGARHPPALVLLDGAGVDGRGAEVRDCRHVTLNLRSIPELGETNPCTTPGRRGVRNRTPDPGVYARRHLPYIDADGSTTG